MNIKYNFDNCYFAETASYMTLANKVDDVYEICKFHSKEECEFNLKELQTFGHERLLDEYILKKEWFEIFSFKGYFFDEWRIILKYPLNFFEKR
jgi:hypothetical protein